MIVTVASGKGGTGKTTITVNLAASMPEGSFEVFDCDVEEPNAHLFVKPQNIVTEEISTMVPAVDMELCTLCEECEKICQFSAITIIAKKVMLFPEMCHSCRGCSMVCPSGAIKESSRVLGSLLTGRSSRGFNLVWGELRVGEAMSPPLIKQVKKRIQPEKLSLIDAPPGTSCPAVTTLRDSDFVLLVAEETPFGLNDLALTVEALKKLGVPMGIVINRADTDSSIKESDLQSDTRSEKKITDNGIPDENIIKKGIIDKYADQEGITIMQRLPFSREAARVCAKGLLLVDEIPEMKALFSELYLKILDQINIIGQNRQVKKSGKTSNICQDCQEKISGRIEEKDLEEKQAYCCNQQADKGEKSI